MAAGTSGHDGLHARSGWHDRAWLLPAVGGTAATVLLSWSAWITAPYTIWPELYHAWWWTILRPDQDGTMLATSALWLASLASYWWPRRLERHPISAITIVAMVLIGGALSTASLVPCRGGMTKIGVIGWLLDLYLGQPPGAYPGTFPAAGCMGQAPLAMQLGQVVCPGATVITALTVGAVLWREPVSRLQSRFASDATVFTGLSPLSLPLLRRLAADAPNPRGIIVIESDDGHALLDEARLTGARVIIGSPTSPRLLQPIISGLGGCALNQLYAVGDKVAENEAVIESAARILRRYQTEKERRPHLVALIDDPRHADAWRGNHGGSSGIWFEDALSSVESTACGLVGRVLNAGVKEVLLCGDSSLALAILLEIARRAWELAELATAAATGRGVMASAAAASGQPAAPSPMPVERVLLIDPRSDYMMREYVASAPLAFLRVGPTVVRRGSDWHDYLLRALDAKDPGSARQTAVIIVDSRHENGLHEGGRIARLHPDTPVFVLASPAEGISRPIFGRMMPFERGLLVDGDVPEDTWRRIARHWHECYRLSHPVGPGDPKAGKRLPWADLDQSTRQDNILQLRSILTEVAALGRRWKPARLVPPGSFIELSDHELEQVALAEHTRWYQRRRAEGWVPGAESPPEITRVTNLTNNLVVPWADLPAEERASSMDHVRRQLMQLEDVGFMPVIPAGGPPEAESFERVGIVRSRRLTAPLRWALRSGEEMLGGAGDWRVIDSNGLVRTVADPEFRSSHLPLADGRWRRIGTFMAWQVREGAVIRTKEGRVTAIPGDWVVEGPGGERWPVSDVQFQASYRARADHRVASGQASMPTAISSTAPTISSSIERHLGFLPSPSLR